VYVLGGALQASVGATGYVEYLVPGILVMTVTSGTVATAISISMDMSEGVINRFRTLAIDRSSVLTGHVVGGVLLTTASLVLVFVTALLIGFRPLADPLRWLGALGLLGLVALALSWLSAALGLIAKRPEGASNIVMPIIFLPFLGSAFVPTDSMPGALRWFAERQPFTPMIETVRELLLGTPSAGQAAASVAWCVGLTLVGWAWSRWLFGRAGIA
jgi:ABC-2 type transport system permease protein